jgi:ABC-type amino acid transport system permease subunit
MALNENLSLQLDLASAQIITTILVTLGATLFAISVGIQLTLPPIVEDVIDQLMTERMIVSDVQYNIVQQALDNYIFLLTAIGALLILVGIIYGSAKIGRIRRKMIRASKDIESNQLSSQNSGVNR